MWDWLQAAQTVHAVLAIVAAIGFFYFWLRTRFWFPRYVHYLGGFALALGLASLVMMPSDAPINQGDWSGLKKALLVLAFPGLVYFFFVFYGGQHAAYRRTHQPPVVECPYCRQAQAVPGGQCPSCGQTIPAVPNARAPAPDCER